MIKSCVNDVWSTPWHGAVDQGLKRLVIHEMSPDCAQHVWQECTLTLGIKKPLKQALLGIKIPFSQMGSTQLVGAGLGSVLGFNL